MRILLQALRIPVLLALLAGITPAQHRLFTAVTRLDLDATWVPWAWMTTLAIAFCVVAFAGRGPSHSRVVLIVEALVAAVLGLVPPTVWVFRFGIGPLTETLGVPSGNLYLPALALAWLVMAVITLLRVVRAGRQPAPQR